MTQNKQKMIDEIFKLLQAQGEVLYNDTQASNVGIAEKLDVLIDTMHFLRDYDENVQVLNRYWLDKKYKEKFKLLDDRS